MPAQPRNRTNYFKLFLANGTILPDGIEADVAASRQSAANRTGAFQMAAFSRKPLRRAPYFTFSAGEIRQRKLLAHGNVLVRLGENNA